MSLYNSRLFVVTGKFINSLLVAIITKFIPTTMESKNIYLVSFVALFAIALAMTSASATFASLTSVEVNGVEHFGSNFKSEGVFAGETLPVRVFFIANSNEADVHVFVRLRGGSGFSDQTERFDVIAGNTYSKLLNVKVPTDIDPDEDLKLLVSVESEHNAGSAWELNLTAERESYIVEILSAEGPEQVRAGQSLPLDIVLKNRGRHEAEDTYVRATISELGVSTVSYFADLSSVDQSDPDKEDSAIRRLNLAIPSNAKPGVYTIQLEAFNSDSSTVRTKRVVVTEGSEDRVIVSSASQKFAAGEDKTYTLTLVNSGNTVKVYTVALDAPTSLDVSTDSTVVVVPAGSSKTLDVHVKGSEQGSYTFSVSVTSDDGTVTKENLTANIEGTASTVNATIVLTVVLAIIFVVLVIVLIVLLTRKPQRTEEFGESYY